MEYNGKHVMCDGVLLNKDAFSTLNTPKLGEDFLEDIVSGIDMTMILPPITVKFPHAICEAQRIMSSLKQEGLENSMVYKKLEMDLHNRATQTYGYSTFVMIAESHLTIHTFPEEGFFTFDCYSCKDFDDQYIRECITKYFGEVKMNYQVVERHIPKV